MQKVAVTYQGIEEITIDEIKQKLKAKAKKIAKARIGFTTDKDITLDTINTLYSLVQKFKFKTIDDIYEKAGKIDFSFIEDPFVVRCHREGTHLFQSKDIERKIGEIIFTQGHKVSLENPKTIVYVDIIDNTLFLGVLIEKDICKRKYHVKFSPASVNACLANALLRIAGLKKSSVVLDPFCRDGVIGIEAALIGAKHVYCFDASLHNIKSARINAKLAKCSIDLSKCELDWLDTKLDKQSLDFIVTSPPFLSKRKKADEIQQAYKELFYQAKYVLKRKGKVVILSPKKELLENASKNNGFKLINERKVHVGNSSFFILVFQK